MGENREIKEMVIHMTSDQIEGGFAELPEVEPVENPVECVCKTPTEYEFKIKFNTALEEMAEAINKLVSDSALTEVLRKIDKDLKTMCEVQREHPKWWHYHLYARKWRTRKKYGNMIIKACEAKDKKEGDTYEYRR